ncbi:unnamed protein product [Orchesella dallaii]|uniref:E3 ubiquitin-protein ligase TRIM71 n=1 Tax=Orchesella dallaii TaxID=48710 RepID=A0ABP1RSA5_9HEXA
MKLFSGNFETLEFLETFLRNSNKLFGNVCMKASFYENLVGDKFPSPPQASVGCSRGRSSTGGSFSQNFLNTSCERFSSTTFTNKVEARRTQIFVDRPTIHETHVMENVRSVTQTRFPLASVDVPLSHVIDVYQYEIWPCNQPRMEESIFPQFLTQEYIFEHFQQPQISYGGQDVIGFLQPLQLLPHPPVANPPVLSIFCNRSDCLTKSVIDFTIHVHNLPPDVQIDATMFEAVVTDPLDDKVVCVIRKNYNINLQSFNGSFHADEDGFYKVLVKLVTPMKIWSLVRNGGVMLSSLDISVSRTYGEESKKKALVIQCEFERADGNQNSQQPQPSQHSTRYGLQHRNQYKFWGLTSDLRTNNIFYTDRAANEVICVNPDGHTLFKFGQRGSTATGRLRCPAGIAYDSEHRRLVIADKDNHRICFFTMDGQFISSFGSRGQGNGMLRFPWDVSVSPAGKHIAVTDSKNKRVQLFDRFGNFLNKYSIFEKNPFMYRTELNDPRGISFDESGKNIYVTDFKVHNVIQIPLDFSFHRKMIPEGKLSRPQGIAVDWLGNLLIVDSRNHCVRQVTSQGDLVSNITRVLDKSLHYPVNVATLSGGFAAVLDGDGKIYIF